MSTIDAIEYEMEKLGGFTQAQLLIQLCCRLDRMQPSAENRTNAHAFALSIAAGVQKLIDSLPSALQPVKDQIQSDLAHFQEVIA